MLYEKAGAHNQPLGINVPISAINSDFKKVGAPLSGSRRLVDEKRFAPVAIIPGNSVAESIYHSTEKPSYLSNFLIQGAPITTTNPVFINRTSVPTSL